MTQATIPAVDEEELIRWSLRERLTSDGRGISRDRIRCRMGKSGLTAAP